MAELVDALVSNTSNSNIVWVQVPLRVLKKSESESESEHSRFFFLKTHSHTHTLFFIFGESEPYGTSPGLTGTDVTGSQ
jgi:hypothetical protein